MGWPKLKRGFQFSEVMGGSYALVDEPDRERRFVFTAHMKAPSLFAHLRDGGMDLRGRLEMDGFADDVPISGRLTMLPFTKKLIRYEFGFTANDGARYQFVGKKDIRLSSLRDTFTTLPGRVMDAAGREIATVLTHFDVQSDLARFLSSWRPA